MEQCPNCGNYMKFNMEYFCGYPQIYYTCTCGYDERTGYRTTYATSTSDSFLNGNIPVAKDQLSKVRSILIVLTY